MWITVLHLTWQNFLSGHMKRSQTGVFQHVRKILRIYSCTCHDINISGILFQTIQSLNTIRSRSNSAGSKNRNNAKFSGSFQCFIQITTHIKSTM